MRIAVTTGDPAGIGPDVALMLLHTNVECFGGEQIILLGDSEVLHERSEMLGVDFACGEILSAANDQAHGPTALLDIKTDTKVTPGIADPRNARHVLTQINTAITGCRNGLFDALVTAPVNKTAINEAGVSFSGHTEYLAATCNCDTVMMLACEGLRAALVTTHLPLSAVPAALTQRRLLRTLQIVHQNMRLLYDLKQPRIAVCGLNPHAGEGGHLGSEEQQIIRPVLEQLADEMYLLGPLPADTAFTPRQLSKCDVVVAMYHDQALPVIKHADFDRAVNITLGLPFVRTSVDHGTALELAGSGRASSTSLSAAVTTATRLARRLRNSQTRR